MNFAAPFGTGAIDYLDYCKEGGAEYDGNESTYQYSEAKATPFVSGFVSSRADQS